MLIFIHLTNNVTILQHNKYDKCAGPGQVRVGRWPRDSADMSADHIGKHLTPGLLRRSDNYKLGPFFAFFTDGEIGRNGPAARPTRPQKFDGILWMKDQFVEQLCAKKYFQSLSCLAQ